MSGKRVRKAPKKYGDEEPETQQGVAASKGKKKKKSSVSQLPKQVKEGGTFGAGARAGAKLSLPKKKRKRQALTIDVMGCDGAYGDDGGQHLKVMDRIPSPQKPAKKRYTARNLFEGDLVSPRTTVPPKKKKHDLLRQFPYAKRNVLSSFESPLCFVDLASIVKEGTFEALFSKEDQSVLAAMLPDIDRRSRADDASGGGSGLSGVFRSESFQSALVDYQTLLKSGCFDQNSPLGETNLRMVDHYKRLLKEVDLSAWWADLQASSARERGSGRRSTT